MKRIIYIGFLCSIIALCYSCKEDDKLMYEEDARVYFLKRNTSATVDSIDYSFALESDVIQADTVLLPFRIMGFPKNYDRAIKLQLLAGSTAKENYHFKIENLYIPANSSDGEAFLILYRKPGLKDSIVTGILQVVASEEFNPGYFDNGWGASRDRTTYKFTISDKLTKPAIWDTRWASMFGTYSDVKIRFLAQATGYRTWNVAVGLPQDQNQMLQKARLALYEYELANGPLLDENNQRVIIP